MQRTLYETGALLLLCMLMGSPVPSSAQGEQAHRYWIRLIAPITDHSCKPLFVSLAEADPMGDFAYNNEQLRIGSGRAWTLSELRGITETLGYHVAAFIHEGSGEREHPMVRYEGWPRYVDTGAPLDDRQRWDTERAAWIEAYPDAYNTMLEYLTENGDAR